MVRPEEISKTDKVWHYCLLWPSSYLLYYRPNRPPVLSPIHGKKSTFTVTLTRILIFSSVECFFLCVTVIFGAAIFGLRLSCWTDWLGLSLLLGGSSLKFTQGSWPCDPEVWPWQLSSMETPLWKDKHSNITHTAAQSQKEIPRLKGYLTLLCLLRGGDLTSLLHFSKSQNKCQVVLQFLSIWMYISGVYAAAGAGKQMETFLCLFIL